MRTCTTRTRTETHPSIFTGSNLNHAPMAENDLVVPEDALAVGAEIAHGSNGVVHDATLCGVRVCAKVRQPDA